MRCLIDTHILIWWWRDDPRLSAAMRALLMDRSTDVWVSAASGWEVATKVRNGKMPEMEAHLASFDALVINDGFQHLDIRQDHALCAGALPGALPGEHRDPFDRMIAAQALIEGLTVMTHDRAIAGFGCDVMR